MRPRRIYLPPVPRVRPAGSWNPLIGFRKMVRPPVIGLAAYQMVRGVPLQPANFQGLVQGWAAVSGSATSPGAFQTLCTASPNAGGVYSVPWTVTLAGTVGGGDANNFRLVQINPLLFLTESVNAGAAGTYPQAPFLWAAPPGASVILSTGPTGPTSGSVYSGSIGAVGGATVQGGPSGLGNLWYPTQVTVATTTGITTGLDTSICNVYLGPAVSPTTLLGTVFGGNGIVAAALPNIQPGQYLIASWAAANPGDIAAMNVQGSMDALG